MGATVLRLQAFGTRGSASATAVEFLSLLPLSVTAWSACASAAVAAPEVSAELPLPPRAAGSLLHAANHTGHHLI